MGFFFKSIESIAYERTSDLVEEFPTLVEEFLAKYPTKTEDEEFTKEWSKLEEKHARIGELLLQELFKLDGVECIDMPEVKDRRKLAVRNIQKLLTESDKTWDKVKAL
ncbi:hypothetical protein CONCODRAFT_19225 [Conidiobolus coronatus NRRL 28638]|uniref:BAG domain-containing protein n=1 Tax=Conidiobolus coronatus (strain ATCC 28846 / CBS 209.66 / NRRL 28638) TaxID=796925 RepID=A0A137NZS6_CONC2|nr:hypothetical protein CONCODRAFT_19225 [Conidiobolus coronatus NRRL 28638]|eukprot:KXN68089.1 hypothetical protein CONCODRAFT_19225 [Conidiobolus coronatus NRRL 28638]